MDDFGLKKVCIVRLNRLGEGYEAFQQNLGYNDFSMKTGVLIA